MFKEKHAFTLIELMITIAVIGIMATVGFISLKSGQDQTKLKAAQAEIVAQIKLAQSYALQGKMQGGVIPQYYGVKFPDAKSYVFCSGDVSCGTSIETYQIKDHIVSDASGKSILFSIPDGTCTLSSNLVISFIISGKTKTITISPGGAITEN